MIPYNLSDPETIGITSEFTVLYNYIRSHYSRWCNDSVTMLDAQRQEPDDRVWARTRDPQILGIITCQKLNHSTNGADLSPLRGLSISAIFRYVKYDLPEIPFLASPFSADDSL